MKGTTGSAFGLALLVLILAGAFYAYRTTEQTLESLRMVDHTQQVRIELERVMESLAMAETDVRGFELTNQDEFLDTFEPAIKKTRTSFESLRFLTNDNKDQQKQLNRLEPLLEKKADWLEKKVKAQKEKGAAEAVSLTATMTGKRLMDEIRGIIHEMKETENQLLHDRSLIAQHDSNKALAVVIAGCSTALVLLAFAAWTVRREIAARRQSERTQEAARVYAESIVDTVSDPLLVLDERLRIQRANRSYCHLFKTTRAETEGRLLGELLNGAWKNETLQSSLEKTFSDNERFDDLGITLEIPGLGNRTLLISGCKLYRPGNHTGAVLMAIDDQTERLRMEQSLKHEHYLLGTLMDNATESIYFKDRESRFIRINRFLAGRFKLSDPEEAVGKTDADFFDAAHSRKALEDEQMVMRTGRAINKEEMEIWPDRRTTWVLTSKLPFWDKAGNIAGTFGLSRDITERKLMEGMQLQFRSLFESLPGLYLVLTPDLKIAGASDAYLAATMTTREQILNRQLFEVFPDNPDDPSANGVSNLRASLDRVLKNAAPDIMAIQKYDVRQPGGAFEERFWSPVNSPVLGMDQKVEYIIHRVEDVTDFVRHKTESKMTEGDLRQRMEKMEAEIYRSSQQVQTANQQLRAVNAELEAFSYSVSHDLLAPLRHVDGFADLLSKHANGMLDEKGKHYLKTINESAKRMGVLVDDLLVFSRMGRSEMRRTRLDMNDLLKEVIAQCEQEEPGRSIRWKCQTLPTVEGDPAMLRQALWNLIANAVKYSRPRNPAVIEVGTNENNDSEVVFFVRDNGVGFDMAYIGKLFGVFQRLHRQSEFEGTGIGLANVQRIILRHGGRVWAESKLDEGSTFYFSLPAVENNPTQPA